MKLGKLIPLNDDLYAKLMMFLLVVMVVAVPFSKFLMSVAQFGFAVIWLANGKYLEKLNAFLRNPPAIIFVSIYILHVVGLAWSTDMDYALKDIRIKLPVLIIPFMFVGFPKISHKQFKVLIYFYTASVLFLSLFLTIAHYAYSSDIKHLLHHHFISHIRYSLSLNLVIFYMLILRMEDKTRGWKDMVTIVLIVWLLWFLFFLQAFTGVIVFLILSFVFLTYLAVKSNKSYQKIIYFGLFFVFATSISVYLVSFIQKYHTPEEIEVDKLDKITASGSLYMHNPELGTENGRYIYIYLSDKELRETWNSRSKIDYDGLDNHKQRIKYTLIRYLTSKDLRKDKEGVEALSDEDILNIENGIANYHYTRGLGVESRLMKIMFEYDNYIRTGNPSGHSVMQRVEYWKTAWSIIKKNFWFGVGTGDMQIAFKDEYILQNTKLSEEARLRSHNQYLSIWVGLGIIGLIWFVLSVFFPAISLNAFKSMYFTLFFITFVVSMLTEDTIETQAGVTFYVFFSSLFLFLMDNGRPLKQYITNEKN